MPIYEPDGTEVTSRMHEGEQPIAEIGLGGAFDQTSVTLTVYSKKLDRQRVTHLLGVEPTRAWNPNERHPLGNKGRTRIVDWGQWYLKSESDSQPVEEKIDSLLAQCTHNLDSWHTLARDYEIRMTVVGHLENWNRELTLSPETLKTLADRKLVLTVDVFFWESEDEESPPSR